MSTRALAQDDFLPSVIQDGLVLVGWWAPRSPPCEAFAPIYERVAQDHPDVIFGKVDAARAPELAAELGVHAVPALMVVRDGILLFERTGPMDEGELRALVDRALALDVDEVRRSLVGEAKGTAAGAG